MIMLLGIDLLGALFFMVGALGMFGGEGSYLPEPWQFPGHNFILITLGIAMMVPYMTYVIKKGKAKR